MKQTAAFISCYSSDTFGVCSALYELGGLVVMHDASGCNSTYHTHDEPRAYYMDSAVYVTALDETQAVLGADEEVISDIITVSQEINPAFIAICGHANPDDYRRGFYCLSQNVRGTHRNTLFRFCHRRDALLLTGIAQAYQALARRFIEPCAKKIPLSVNILGATPLDFSVNGQIEDIKAWLTASGFTVNSCWSMGCSLEEIKRSAQASVNLVISSAALTTAKILEKEYHIPYVAGVPYGVKGAALLAESLRETSISGKSMVSYQADTSEADYAIIGEGVTAGSLAHALSLEKGIKAQVICPLESSPELLRKGDETHLLRGGIITV